MSARRCLFLLMLIGPSTSGESMKLKGLAGESEMILLSCAAAETIVNPPAKWVFKVAPMDSFAAQMIFSTMKKMGISRIGVLCSNSGFGQGGKAPRGAFQWTPSRCSR